MQNDPIRADGNGVGSLEWRSQLIQDLLAPHVASNVGHRGATTAQSKNLAWLNFTWGKHNQCSGIRHREVSWTRTMNPRLLLRPSPYQPIESPDAVVADQQRHRVVPGPIILANCPDGNRSGENDDAMCDGVGDQCCVTPFGEKLKYTSVFTRPIAIAENYGLNGCVREYVDEGSL
ncbi:hypothetical protein MASR1M101_10550 [Gemmatimonas sp.]